MLKAAHAAARTHTYLGAQYHRLAKRRRAKKALFAVARSILVIIYYLLERNVSYQDLGTSVFDERDRQALQKQLVRRLECCCCRLHETGTRYGCADGGQRLLVCEQARASLDPRVQPAGQTVRAGRTPPGVLPADQESVAESNRGHVGLRQARIVEPARLLSGPELFPRVSAYIGCAQEPHLAIPDKAA